MTTRLEEAIARVQKNIERCDDLTREILRTVGALGPLPGGAALAVGVDQIAAGREAMEQALEELEIEDGAYLG